ncbi:DUF2206 domain-containing protein [Patescibacteria group bacterium]|nr:DUF2206 domain-containing protein [Patescibacteria group bacterium]
MILGVASILVVAVITILVATEVIKAKHYPYCIGIMALGLVYSTTMLGDYVVGSDIQGELAVSQIALSTGWDFLNGTTSGGIGGSITSIVMGFLVPWLSKLSSIDAIWIYKAILPLFLVGVPVILYYAFKEQIGSKRAFYASLFFIVMPVYSLEIAQIAKSMVAEFFFALMILAMVGNWSLWYKGTIILTCLILTIICHYTVGIAALLYLLGIVMVRLATSKSKWGLFSFKRIPVAILSIIFILCSGTFYVYYHYASKGAINQQLSFVSSSYSTLASNRLDEAKAKHEEEKADVADEKKKIGTSSMAVSSNITVSKEADNPSEAANPSEAIATDVEPYSKEHGHLVLAGTGLDFIGQPIEGKIFRIVQYLTQLLIVIGAGYLLFRHSRYKFTAEFTAGVGCSFVLLLCGVFVPHFDLLINITRIYHMSLFFLAPMLVLGCEGVANGSTKNEIYND